MNLTFFRYKLDTRKMGADHLWTYSSPLRRRRLPTTFIKKQFVVSKILKEPLLIWAEIKYNLKSFMCTVEKKLC